MNAVCVYVSTAQLVLQADTVTSSCEQRLLDLNRLLPHLRQLLSCVVCCRLLCDPYAPHDGRCQHYVCRLCVRGRKSLRPICGTCKDYEDYKTYDENRQMRCLLLCYKSLCEHIMTSSVFTLLSKQKPVKPMMQINPAIPSPHMSTQELVLEGARYEDFLSCFSADLPHPIAPRFTSTPIASHTSSVATAPLTPIVHSNMVSHLPSIQKAVAANAITATLLAAPPLVKQEHFSSPSATVHFSHTHQQSQTHTLTPHSHTQSVTLKHLKSIIDLSSAVQIPIGSVTASSNSTNFPGTTPTITYVGHNTPGIVVPMVSSAGTTTAPLTIASAKLQSLNRHLAQARNAISVSNAASVNSDGLPPLTFKVSSLAPTATLSSAGITTATTTTSTVTSQQIRNPPPIKTVSNGSAMYSVLYTGIGNKITIKRKTDADDDIAQKKSRLIAPAAATVFRQIPKFSPRRRGCRCGNATATPGKLTCCGQRCPCYVDSKSCIGCKCRGCRNPHRPDGGKVRPVIPELACYEIQMADENSNLSPNELSIGTSNATIIHKTEVNETNALPQLQQQTHQIEEYAEQALPSAPQLQLNNLTTTNTSNTATLIPFRNLQHIATVSQTQPPTLTALSGNHHTHHQHQQQQQAHNTSNLLQRESVLIQNAEGKYQVVNVFTAGAPTDNSNHISGIQRIQAISQLQVSSANSGSSNTFILPNASTPATVPTTSISMSTMPQIIMQQRTSSNSALPMQLQQQLKQNNIITVHPISSSHAASSTQTQTTVPLISPSSASNTITLSPIIVTSPNCFAPDFLSDSSDDFISMDNGDSLMSVTNQCANAPHIVTMSAPQTSPLAFSSALGSVNAAHLSTNTTMIEVIESNDL